MAFSWNLLKSRGLVNEKDLNDLSSKIISNVEKKANAKLRS